MIMENLCEINLEPDLGILDGYRGMMGGWLYEIYGERS